MAPQKIVLIYFPGRGRAELSRWVLKQAEVDFEDRRVAGEQWQELKPDIPTGQLPCAEIDGQKICQSGAIAYYLAQQFGLAGSNDWEKAQVHMIYESVADLMNPMIRFMFEKDEAKKAEMSKEWRETTLPKWLGVFAKTLGKRDWLVGDKLSLADLAVACLLTDPRSQENVAEALKAAPEVSALIQRVTDQPNIKKWMEIRPDSTF